MKEIGKLVVMLSFLLVTSYLLPVTNPTSAHMAGQPPFFKLNGKYSNLYSIPLTSLNDFVLPQDIAVENYLINQNIEMEMDTNVLPIPKEVLEKTKFTWDFGDGTKGEGLKNNHTYTKAGSYIMVIYAQYENSPPQLLQSTLLHILPDTNYQLPTVVIKVNGKQAKDPLTDVLRFNFENEITLDGTKSESKSSKIVEYFWDLGDGKSQTGSKVKYTYDPINYAVFPVLRVKDRNGFLADGYVQVVNDEDAPTYFLGDGDDTNNKRNIIIAIGGVILIGLIGAFFFTRLSNKVKR